MARGVNHGTFLHIAHEEGLIRNSSIHAGIRAPVSNPKYDLKNDKACGFHILKARDLDRLGTAGFVEKLLERTASTKVYISVDIDVLDPAYAPATGTSVSFGKWNQFSRSEYVLMLSRNREDLPRENCSQFSMP